MDFRPLQMFVEVVRQGGFSQAARKVFATQSTVSKAVKQLEDEIGMPLLDRIGHRSVMTAAGEIVFERGVRLLTAREDLIGELDEIRGLKRGVLRLGLPPVGSNTLFAPLFAVYRQRYPGIDVRLVEHGSKRLQERLRAGDVDLAAILQPVADDLDWQVVRCEPLVAVLSPTHPLASRRSVSLKELKDTPFILFEDGFVLHRIILDASAKAGFEPNVIACSSQVQFMVALVAAGLGVTFLPRMTAAKQSAPVKTALLKDKGTDWTMTLAWRRGAYLSGAARAWLDLVTEVYGKDATSSGNPPLKP